MAVHVRDDGSAQPEAAIRHDQSADIEGPPDVIDVRRVPVPLPEEPRQAVRDSIAEQKNRSRNGPPARDSEAGANWSATNIATGAVCH